MPVEELSDDCQTDYDEEAVESALSDYEAFTQGSEHTEEEETADTAETVCTKRHHLLIVHECTPQGFNYVILPQQSFLH